jgi:ATP-binding cassette subfamily B protein
MERLLVGRISTVIAHRLSTVRNLDRILAFDHGKIVEDGTHDGLLEHEDCHYRRLFDHQEGNFVGLAAE